MSKITGYAAIEYAESHGLTLNKYADPTEDAREGLSPDEAREIASEDPSLIYKKGDHHPCCADAPPRLWQIVDRETRDPIIGGLSRSDATYRAIEMRREARRTGTFLSVEVVPE